MDPLSIATTVTALAKLCSQVVILCNNLAGRYQSMRRALIVLRTEISTYQTALHHVQDLLLDQSGPLASYLGSKNEWTDSFDTALSACSITTSILISELEKALDAASGSFITYTLKEGDIKDLTNELRGQQSGVQLLVQTLQLQSTTDIIQLLHKNQDILKKVRKQTDRLSSTWGMHLNAETNETFSIFSLDIEDKRFGFDDELSRLGPYRRALIGQQEQQEQRPGAVPNLIDDDLLDLSIDALSPGRWTEELQHEFIEEPTRLAEFDLLRMPIEDMLDDVEDKQIGSAHSMPTLSEERSIDTNDEPSRWPTTQPPTSGILLPMSKGPPKHPAIEEIQADQGPVTLHVRSDSTVPSEIIVATELEAGDEAMRDKNANSSTSGQAGVDIQSPATSLEVLEVRNSCLVAPKLGPLELESIRARDHTLYSALVGSLEGLVSLRQWPVKTPRSATTKALRYAAISGHKACLIWLLENLPKETLALEAETKNPNALHWAIIHGHRDICQILMTKFCVNCPCILNVRLGERLIQLKGWTALSLATHFGHDAIVAEILYKNVNNLTGTTRCKHRSLFAPKPSLIPPFHAGIGSLQYFLTFDFCSSASTSANFADLLALHSLGPGVNCLHLSGPKARPPDQAVLNSGLQEKRALLVLRMLANIQKPNGDLKSSLGEDGAGLDAIQAAACGPHSSVLEKLLSLERSETLDKKLFKISKARKHISPLHLAAFWGQSENVKILLRNTESPDVLDHIGRTPLHFAASTGDPATVLQLMNAGAQIDFLGGLGWSDKYVTPLSLALDMGRWDTAKTLIQAGASLTEMLYPSSGMGRSDTILHFVVKSFHSRKTALKAMVLLRNGAASDVVNSQGLTPLDILVESYWRTQSHPSGSECMACLLKYGANPNRVRRKSDGNTLFHRLVQSGSEDGSLFQAVKIFLEFGADTRLKNRAGQDVVSIALSLRSKFEKNHVRFQKDDYLKVLRSLGYQTMTGNRFATKAHSRSHIPDRDRVVDYSLSKMGMSGRAEPFPPESGLPP